MKVIAPFSKPLICTAVRLTPNDVNPVPVVRVLVLWVFTLVANCSSVHSQDIRIPEPPEFPEVEFSVEGGIFGKPQTVELFCEGAEIYYSIDGEFPTRESRRYTRPLHVVSTAVVRAAAWRDGQWGPVAAHTYLIGEPETAFATVSLTTEPGLLFDADTGLYMSGAGYDSVKHLGSNANFLSHDEITGNCEIFAPDGSTLWRSYCGLRLFGGISRFFPQKSLTIVARNRYGKKRIRKRLFENGPDDLKFIVLRNSGSDFGKSHFRDMLMTGLVEDLNVDKQAGRPAHVYINGHYWGVYNIREKINRYFISDHYPVHEDSLDLIEHRMGLKRGSTVKYRQLLDYLRSHDLSDSASYAHVRHLMDVDNFMDYQLSQIYFDNRDAGGNIRFWRPQRPGGLWRWILYDTDWGFALHDPNAWAFNSLAFHTRPDGPFWPNPPWSTFILRKLLEQDAFQKEFAGRMAAYLSSCFSADFVSARIDSLAELYRPELPRHFKRWRLSEHSWESHVSLMKDFARKRPETVRQFFREAFQLGRDVPVNISSEAGGSILLNGHLTLECEEFCGIWFDSLPLKLEARAQPGYRFAGWEGLPIDTDSTRKKTVQELSGSLDLRAVFEPYLHPAEGQVLINEISCYDTGAEDWIELYNRGDVSVDVSGWIVADKKNHQFALPPAVIHPGEYLVICENAAEFSKAYPREYRFVGDLGFGINKHDECLWLYSSDGALVDSLCYKIFPNDTAFTLSLLMPELDNSRIENWEVLPGPGTPNTANPFYYESSIKKEQQRWMRTGAGIGMLLSITFLVFRFTGSGRH